MKQGNFHGSSSWSGKPSHGSRAVRYDGKLGKNRGPSGFHSPAVLIALLYLLLATGVATATVSVMHGRSNPLGAAVFSQRAKYLVLIVLDGARPDYFGLTSLPHVDALRSQGTQYTNAFDGILEAETPSGHTTLATGSSPARNGILGFDWGQNDTDYSLFSPDVVNSGAMEHIMQNAGVPTLAGLYKARYPKAKVVALSGHKYYAADPLGGPQADVIMYYQGDTKGRYVPVAIPGHAPPASVFNAPGLTTNSTTLSSGVEDTLATKLALSAFHTLHQQMTLINYPEFDWPLGHVYGGRSDRTHVISLMKSFDRDLGRIEDAYRKAGILDRTLFVITADHGMTPVKRFVPDSVITNAVAQAGTTAPAISYNTGTYVWLADPAKSQTVAQNITKENDPGVQSVYYLTGSGHSAQYARASGSFVNSKVDGANQYLLRTLMNGHQPQVVTFCRENQSFSNPDTHWKGDHGGASWQSQHIPLILSGPDIQPGVTVKSPAQLEDVAPTVLTAMGVLPTGMEGKPLTEAIQVVRKRDSMSRSAETRQLKPVTDALVAQDAYESAH